MTLQALLGRRWPDQPALWAGLDARRVLSPGKSYPGDCLTKVYHIQELMGYDVFWKRAESHRRRYHAPSGTEDHLSGARTDE